jgi:L-lyxonate dehydratase
MTRVASIETIPVAEPGERPDDEWVTAPSDVFLEPGSRRTSDLPRPQPGVVSNVIVRIRTDDGLEGLGTVGVASPASPAIIDHHLAPLVVGQSPFDVELVWERMFRATINIGRKGLVLEAISAIDIALWDIIGKATGQPVYNLLGGRTRDRIRAYVSQSYAKADLGAAREEAASYRSQGFTALKMRFGYGPTDGEAGKRKNYDLVATVRDAIGPDCELMADAYMGWDLAYAIDMIRRLEDLNLRWVEEPLVPDDIEGYVRLRSVVSTSISAGEHEFTRWGYRELLSRGAVDIVQPDVNRMGGITEARKVWALASAFNVPVIPHSHQSHNAHLIMAHVNSPLIEFFPTGVHRTGYTLFTEFFEGEPQARNGWVELGDAPGLGISLNEDVLEEYALPSVTHA